MVIVARIYLVLTLVMLGGVGIAALVAPDVVAKQLQLMPQSGAGTAELRALYGGAFISWAALLIAAWRNKALRGGFLLAVGTTLGAIAAARIVSLAIDHEFAFNIPAMASEALIALACWVLYRNEKVAQ